MHPSNELSRSSTNRIGGSRSRAFCSTARYAAYPSDSHTSEYAAIRESFVNFYLPIENRNLFHYEFISSYFYFYFPFLFHYFNEYHK